MKVKIAFWLLVILILLVCLAPLFSLVGCTREVDQKILKTDYKIDSLWFWQFSSGDNVKSDTVLGQLFYTFSNKENTFSIPTEFKYGLTVSRDKFNFLTKEGKLAITDSFNNFHKNNWDPKLWPGNNIQK